MQFPILTPAMQNMVTALQSIPVHPFGLAKVSLKCTHILKNNHATLFTMKK